MQVNLDNPIKPIRSTSLEEIEKKEFRVINNLCKRLFTQQLKDYPIEDKKDLIVYITYNNLYYVRHKKRKAKNKNK
jgi:hypothetical protein